MSMRGYLGIVLCLEALTSACTAVDGPGPIMSTCDPTHTVGAPLESLRGYIAFVVDGQLGAVCPDGSDLRTGLAPIVDTALDFRFEPSPDGQRVLVSYAQTSGAFDLIEVASGTTTALTLPTMSVGERHGQGAWSPDGRSIAYAINGKQLWVGAVTEASVTNLRGLLSYEGDIYNGLGNPSWSPDGNRIALSEGGKGNGLGESVGVVDTATRSHTRIRPSQALHGITEPVWSPDGSRLAFTSCCFGDASDSYYGEIWVMDADGANALELARGTSPSWSPNGGSIVYVADGDLYNVTSGDLWIVPSGGGSPHELLQLPHPGAQRVRWVR